MQSRACGCFEESPISPKAMSGDGQQQHSKIPSTVDDRNLLLP